uniref:Uncharacterized protein n=1 Tax=Plectus sambesii TaxID=2011161 RepID=A0A914XHM3_9BILA
MATVVAPIFDAEPLVIEGLASVSGATTGGTEAYIVSYNPASAAIWPWCPNHSCFNKNLNEQRTGVYICGPTQSRGGCGREWSAEGPSGATVLVMAVLGDEGGLEEYKIFTRGVRRLVSLLERYSGSFDLVAALEMMRFLLLASVQLVINCKERALNINRIEIKEDNDKKGPEDDNLDLVIASAIIAPPRTVPAATSGPVRTAPMSFLNKEDDEGDF